MAQEETTVESISPEEAIAVLNGRATSYRLFARLFLSPLSDADIETLVAADLCAWSKGLDEGSPLAQGMNDMGRALRRRNTGTRQQLATDFTMCFDGVAAVGNEVAVPYASVYLSESGLLNQEPRNEVYHLYLSENTKLKSDVFLPEDHLSFELEFVAVMSEKAAAALQEEGGADYEEYSRVLELSRSFLQNNVLTWYGMFADRARKLLNNRFYTGLLAATGGYLDLDLETIEDLLTLC